MGGERVQVGRILKPHGLRGDVVVAATGSDPSRLRPGQRLYIDRAGEAKVRVASARWIERGWLVRFDGRDDRTSVEELAGARLYLEKEELPPPPEGEFYHFQLEGLAVTRADGGELGKVERVLDLPENDIYEVRGPGGIWLIPGRREFVEWIDLQRGELRLTDRADLLEAQLPGSGAKPDGEGRRRHRPGRGRRGRDRRSTSRRSETRGPAHPGPRSQGKSGEDSSSGS